MTARQIVRLICAGTLIILWLTWSHPVKAATGDCSNLVRVLLAEEGVREVPLGSNRGPRVDQYSATYKLDGVYWCACFTGWGYIQIGLPPPGNAWVPSWDQAAFRINSPVPGAQGLVWGPSAGRYIHIYTVVRVDRFRVMTIEGNTSGGGSRNGDGVYVRWRELKGSRFVFFFPH